MSAASTTIRGRDLVRPDTFARLVAYSATHEPIIELAESEEGVEGMLLALKVYADDPAAPFCMPAVYDRFWHDFQLHQRQYAEFEADHAGGARLWHEPGEVTETNEADLISAMTATLARAQALGLPVDPKVYAGRPSPCPGTGSPFAPDTQTP